MVLNLQTCLVALMLLIQLVVGSTKIGSIENEEDVREYFSNYGYYSKFTTDPKEEMKRGIVRFQEFAGLPATGNLDSETMKLINTDRCGVADLFDIKTSNRAKRYVRQGSSWRKARLTWRVVNVGSGLDLRTVKTVMRRAFQYWSDETNLDFFENTDDKIEPDIYIQFVRYVHNDPFPFDGPGGTLAHAFYPQTNEGLSGDVHFDDDEHFTYQSSRGRNLLWVATHELGHSLGLDHSNKRDAVMYPWYTKYAPGFKLTEDDIAGIQSIYGRRTKPRITTTAAPAPEYTRPCPSSQISAIYYNSHVKFVVAISRNNKIYFLNKQGGVKHGPLILKTYLPKVKGTISAAVNVKKATENNKDATIIFAGKNYYIYQNFKFISGPHNFHENNELGLVFPKNIEKVDAALYWKRNGKMYFFSGHQYWRYDPNRKVLDSGYPKQITAGWRGIPSPIDAAYSDPNGEFTFLLHGDKFYKMNDYYVRIERGFPKHYGDAWFQCRASEAANIIPVGGLINPDEKEGSEP